MDQIQSAPTYVCCDSSKAALTFENVGVERHFGDLSHVKMSMVWSGLCTKVHRQVEELLQVCWRTSGKSLLWLQGEGDVDD